MTRYFFDFDDGSAIRRDTEGSVLADLEAAQREALDTLLQIGRDHVRAGDRVLSMDVRTEQNDLVARVRLEFSIGKLPRP